MSWQITEDNDKLTMTKYFEGPKALLEIQFDHSTPEVSYFEGQVQGTNISCTGPSFFGVMDRLLNMAYQNLDQNAT